MAADAKKLAEAKAKLAEAEKVVQAKHEAKLEADAGYRQAKKVVDAIKSEIVGMS